MSVLFITRTAVWGWRSRRVLLFVGCLHDFECGENLPAKSNVDKMKQNEGKSTSFVYGANAVHSSVWCVHSSMVYFYEHTQNNP